jgi:hypothetical protein
VNARRVALQLMTWALLRAIDAQQTLLALAPAGGWKIPSHPPTSTFLDWTSIVH